MKLPAERLRALSIRQPWAMSIVTGTKRIENRSWDTRFRGLFLIHAGKGMTRDEFDGWAHMILAEDIRWPGLRGRIWRPSDFEGQRGGIIGAARLVDVARSREAVAPDQRPWFFGPVGFVLADVVPVPFMPCKGALGFFSVEPEVEAQARLQLVRA